MVEHLPGSLKAPTSVTSTRVGEYDCIHTQPTLFKNPERLKKLSRNLNMCTYIYACILHVLFLNFALTIYNQETSQIMVGSLELLSLRYKLIV